MANQILTEKQRIELEQTVGWCGDKIQRVKDLYQVNTVSGWAINRIRITTDMAQDRGLPDFFVKNLREIERKMITVATLEDSRNPPIKKKRRNLLLHGRLSKKRYSKSNLSYAKKH